jgi:multisubunit Na+/H+ antiporter MnhC subunit
MVSSIATGLIVILVVIAFLFIARRVFRLALKLAFIGVIVFLLIVGAAVGWWRGWFGSASPTPSTQHSNSNRGNRAR